MQTNEQFLQALRTALNHLYDPDHLRESPLVSLFGVASQFDAPSALQRILIQAIEFLKPDSHTPISSDAWMMYEVLFFRYVQQVSQPEVADQLGFGVRHLRRKQRAAIEILAWHLWKQFDLELVSNRERREQTEPTQGDVGDGYKFEEELAWLENAKPQVLREVSQALMMAVDLARPLAVQRDIQLQADIANDLPGLLTHPIALRQIVLNVLGIVIRCTNSEEVCISANHIGKYIDIQVQGCECPAQLEVDSKIDADSLRLTRRMVTLCQGSLDFLVGSRAFKVLLKFPVLQRIPVLALDDNADFLHLLERYVAETEFQVIGTRDPEKALRLAGELAPAAILLDVMMPNVDGWEVLARLRQHPSTGHLPIIVCTILVQEDLAIALGADAFLRKPLTQQALLTALDVYTKRRAPGYH